MIEVVERFEKALETINNTINGVEEDMRNGKITKEDAANIFDCIHKESLRFFNDVENIYNKSKVIWERLNKHIKYPVSEEFKI